MALSYNNLWKLLIDRKMTKTDLRLATRISTVPLAKLSKGEPVMTTILDRICREMKCHVGDIVDHVADESHEGVEV